MQTDTRRRKVNGKYGGKEEGDVDISDLSVSALFSNVSGFDSGYPVFVDILSRYRKMPGQFVPNPFQFIIRESFSLL